MCALTQHKIGVNWKQLALQVPAVPLSIFGRRLVGTLKEFHQRCFWRVSSAHVVVHQQEFFHLRMVVSALRTNPLFRETRRLGRRIGVESGSRNVTSTRPKSGTAHFVRVGFASDGIGSRPLGCSSARKSSHGQVETSPEKMDGADLAYKSPSKLLEYLVDPHQNAPEFMHRFLIIGRVNPVPFKWSRVGNFAGHCPNL